MPSNASALRRDRLSLSLQSAATVPGLSPLRIAGLDLFPLREPTSGRTYTVVAVRTSGGDRGFGECLKVSPSERAAALAAIRDVDATAAEVLRARLAAVSPGLQAAINMAALDVTARAAKVPVYQLLGGPTRFKARALLALAAGSESDISSAIERGLKSGFRAFALPLPQRDPSRQIKSYSQDLRAMLDRLRARAGDTADFVVDAAGSLRPGEAANVSAAIESFHPLWLDEPCAQVNLAAFQKVAAERVTPVGSGRTVTHGAEFQNLLREQALDVLRPDIALNGITAIRRMAALAETYYTAVAPFHNGGPVATAAALHLAASIPNFFIQQVPDAGPADRKFRSEVAGIDLETPRDGFFSLPSGPGLGVPAVEDNLRRLQEKAA